MTQVSEVTIKESFPGAGGYQAPGASGKLCFFDTADRGADFIQEIDYPIFIERFGGTSRSAKLFNLYSQQRGSGVKGVPKVDFSRVRSSTAAKATRTLLDRQGVPVNTLRLDAVGVGVSGQNISCVVTDGRLTETFTLEVKFSGTTVDTYIDVSMDVRLENYVVTAINKRAKFVRATDLRPVNTVFAANQNPALGTFTLAGGTDGAALTNQDYLDALARFSASKGNGILYTPTPASAVATAMLAHGRYKFPVIDTPIAQGYTLNKALRDSFNSGNGMMSRGEAYTVADPNILLPLGITWAAGQLLNDAASGPHEPFSNTPILGIEGFSSDYEADIETYQDSYELNGITTFRRLADGGVGPFGLNGLTNSGPFVNYNVRRTFWYVYEQLQRIIRPKLHRSALNVDTFRDIDNSVDKFFKGIVEARGMTVGPGGAKGTRGVGWDWKANGETTDQGTLDAGGLKARFGMKVPRALRYVEIEASEFEAPAVTEAVVGVI